MDFAKEMRIIQNVMIKDKEKPKPMSKILFTNSNCKSKLGICSDKELKTEILQKQ